MGFYHGSSQPPPHEKEPGGCMEAFIISRAVFGVLALPLGIMLGVILGIILLFWLFSIHWLLGLVGVAAIAGGIGLFARWERGKFRAGGL